MRDFSKVKRIVVKIGTNTITKADGSIDLIFLKRTAKQLLSLKKQGKEIIIVSSGAIGSGVRSMRLKQMPRDIKLRQAAAAIGQTTLMNQWQKAFGNQVVAQLLLTYESFTNRKTYLNLINSINALLKLDVIPIINENDPIAIDEIGASFGDNDKMCALVASKVDAGLLILMSDTDGLYNRNPKKNKDVELIKEVLDISPEIKRMADKASARGKGGMISKLESAEICSKSGVYMIIANGKENNVVTKLLEGNEIGTLFIPQSRLSNKHRWIKFTSSKGRIIVDEGAMAALKNGKNLLPVGVKRIEGFFDKGDVVDICCRDKSFAKAIAHYSSKELYNAKGKSGYENVYSKENVVLI